MRLGEWLHEALLVLVFGRVVVGRRLHEHGVGSTYVHRHGT